MSLRCRSGQYLALSVTLGFVAGCNRGGPIRAREPATRADQVSPAPAGGGVRPGISPEMVLGNIHNPYAGNREAIAAGRQLFIGFNCAGCHSSYAGGGMGPALRDLLWIYGSRDVQIFSTIAEGRPNGMPAWGARLPADQIWRLVAYIQTLGTSAEPEKPPVPSQSKVRAAPQPKRADG